MSDQLNLVSWPDGVEPRGIAFHLPGLPNRTQPISGITEFLLSENLIVIQPQYSGMFDSGGDFEPPKLHQPILRLADYVLENPIHCIRSGQQLDFRGLTRYLSAHSFGSYVGMNCLKVGGAFSKAIFFAPRFELGEDGPRFGQSISLIDHARYVESAFPRTIRIPRMGYLVELFAKYELCHISWSDSCSPDTEAICVSGELDPAISVEANLLAVKGYFEDCREKIKFKGHFVSKGANHSVSSMLNDEVTHSIRSFLS